MSFKCLTGDKTPAASEVDNNTIWKQHGTIETIETIWNKVKPMTEQSRIE